MDQLIIKFPHISPQFVQCHLDCVEIMLQCDSSAATHDWSHITIGIVIRGCKTLVIS